MKKEKRKLWCEQLLNTSYLLPRIKLKLFGSTMTGKTQLTNSLRAGLLSAFLRKKLNSVGELTGFTVEQKYDDDDDDASDDDDDDDDDDDQNDYQDDDEDSDGDGSCQHGRS
ncbi:unnamed protein product [Echinostoma caproni]|uniref:Uncharacterized protein n=1 Tax=Echinostoma caproni TaxID=27848 RepID=A0A183ACL3_9TREM|nr:unnamed protein product [Echinostoma caproni]